MPTGSDSLRQADFHALALFRYQVRRFLHFSEQAARAAGIEPAQHQLLLALRGLAQDDAASITDLAEWLQVRHHTAVELVDRAAEHGLVERHTDLADRRRVHVRLTPAGAAVLETLSQQHRDELLNAAPALDQALHHVLGQQISHSGVSLHVC